jgi:hypothetical protein
MGGKVINDAKNAYIMVRVSDSEKEKFDKMARKLNEGEDGGMSRIIRTFLRQKYRETFPEEFKKTGE